MEKYQWQERRITLGRKDTPLERLENLEQHVGYQGLWIKRDDLNDLALSGNKVRKLEFFAYEAVEAGSSVLLTFGGPQTNHGRLTVAAARRLDMQPVLILDGQEPDRFSGNLVLDLLMGADIRFRGDVSREEMAARVIEEYESKGHIVYVIPLGGSNATGVLGYVQMMLELKEQMKEKDITPAHIYLAVGSAGMLAGTVLGAKLIGLETKIHGIPVLEADAADLKALTVRLAAEARERFDIASQPVTEADFSIDLGPSDHRYFGAGYNLPDPYTIDTIERFARYEGIFLDPCYSGKAGRAYLEQAASGSIGGEPILLIHSGGVPALWTDEHLSAMQGRLKDLSAANRDSES
ncbi:MAG TPA: pyridoxal-phosphate dependent enzyme [Fastidiosipila sp.]|jgi:1-aminocyclopropane-1-carboxylate deaminase/D-cysteine desulfhydrase-like pyridoxal-dependent ACC family enzyme|nr:pyridoxal-phosphate dependent enzyme [Fastidiosipila sp.]